MTSNISQAIRTPLLEQVHNHLAMLRRLASSGKLATFTTTDMSWPLNCHKHCSVFSNLHWEELGRYPCREVTNPRCVTYDERIMQTRTKYAGQPTVVVFRDKSWLLEMNRGPSPRASNRTSDPYLWIQPSWYSSAIRSYGIPTSRKKTRPAWPKEKYKAR